MSNFIDLFSSLGTIIDVNNTNPISLSETDYAWFVLEGYVDLFSYLIKANNLLGTRKHIYRFKPGQLIISFNYAKYASQIDFIGVGLIGTRLLKIAKKDLAKVINSTEEPRQICQLIEEYFQTIINSIQIKPRPLEPLNQAYLLEQGTNLAIPENVILYNNEKFFWFEQTSGISYFYDEIEINSKEQKFIIPITNNVWLRTKTSITANCYDTKTIFQKQLYTNFSFFQELISAYILEKNRDHEQKNVEKLLSKQAINKSAFSLAKLDLIATTGVKIEENKLTLASNDLLFEACNIVAAYQKIKLIRPSSKIKNINRDMVNDIALASKMRVRKVKLVGKWWKEDSGPLLLVDLETKMPFALIPHSPNSYKLYDVTNKTIVKVTPQIAGKFKDPIAYMFYRPLPDKVMSIKEMIKFGLEAADKKDLIHVILLGFLIGILSMALPFLTGIIIDTIIPNAEKNQLIQIVPLILAMNFGSFLFQICSSLAMQRYVSKTCIAIQAALWDRLLNLPVSFFRKFSSGDIANASMGIDTMQTTVLSSSMASLVTNIFSVINILLLIYYSFKLTLIALFITILAIIVTVLCSWLQLKKQRQLLDLKGKVNNIILEIIKGIAKFRIAGAENRIFRHWTENFSQQKIISFKIAKITNYLTTFNAILPVFSSMILYYILMKYFNNPLTPALMAHPISMGNFMGFITAFAIFLSSMTALSSAFVGLLSVKPTFDRLKPILDTQPETHEIKSTGNELSGVIKVNNLCFSYEHDGPQVLKNISFQVNPGEFVAIVGESGCGKSTLLRLLLGFEKPDAGNIFYDDFDLNDMDIVEVRNQLGVVLQNGKLLAGDIFSNIVGSSNLTEEDAWRAVRLAGIEEEIRELPMGMHTYISEQSGSFSGGQKQRILISRALAKNPKIIYFDEATSALDNITQTVVSQSLDALKATRVIIAQRLSTIINADKIIVINKGEIVQIGNFNELIKEEGLFADLAKRQII